VEFTFTTIQLLNKGQHSIKDYFAMGDSCAQIKFCEDQRACSEEGHQ
jgi:hypothetical protein